MIKSLRNRKGFTLIELLVVVLILGVLVAVALPSYISSTATAKANAANANAKALATAIQSAGVKAGAFPASALADSGVLADMGGTIPQNPCSASAGAAGYTYTKTDATNASIVPLKDTCSGMTATTFTLKL